MEPGAELVVELSRIMVGVAYQALEGRLGLREFRALAFIAQRGTCRVGELAEDSALAAASTKRLCDRLVAHGWVRRTTTERDRRRVLLEVTASGQQLVDSVLDARAQRLTAALQDLTPAQQRALDTLLPPLVQALRRVEARPVWAV